MPGGLFALDHDELAALQLRVKRSAVFLELRAQQGHVGRFGLARHRRPQPIEPRLQTDDLRLQRLHGFCGTAARLKHLGAQRHQIGAVLERRLQHLLRAGNLLARRVQQGIEVIGLGLGGGRHKQAQQH